MLNTTRSLDRGPLTTPKSLPACRATAAPPKQLSPPNSCRLRNNCPLRKQWGRHCHSCAPGISRAPAQQTQLVRGPLPPRRRSSLPVDRATAAPPKQESFPKRQSPPKRGDQSQRTRCAHSHKLVPSLPVFTPFCFVVLPHFYLVFTPSRSVIFTPIFPHFYPTVSFYPLKRFTPVLPHS